MNVHLVKLKEFIISFFKKIGEDNAFDLAASLAYYAVFSLAPFLFIVINALGLVFNQDKIRRVVFDGLAGLLGADGAEQLKNALINMGITDAGWLKNVIGLVVLIFTATTIFATIQNGLNYVFRVKIKSKGSVLKFFKTRLIAFAVIMGFTFITLISLFLNGMLILFADVIHDYLPKFYNIFDSLNDFFLPYFVSILIFTIIFRFLPDAKASWRDLIIGASFTGLLFSLGRFLIGFYIGTSGIASVYDAAGSLMVIFVWMYYSSFIFYIGAIFTVLFAEQYGSGLSVGKGMVRFVQKEVEMKK